MSSGSEHSLMQRTIWLGVMAGCLTAMPMMAAEPKRTIDFNRDIRPIFSNKCFQCHGPDAAERKGGTDGLRLDTLAGATADLGGHAAIVAKDPVASLALVRMASSDPDLVMPPASTGKKVTAAELALLTEWVRQGAPYAQHWSYVAAVRADVPQVDDPVWSRSPVDRFLRARLKQEGMTPLPEADRATLVRRVALDLTGLPPTRADLQAYLRDQSPDAYEKMVDRFLQRPAYGEHWARLWLDLARYADSAGYADDPARTIWAYRDYVVRSFNQNKRFDQFTIEQIAGDLLPNPTEDQLIATAFHRNTLTNSEGGTNDEEFRNVAIVDRVNTTFAVWMGTTMACAQCHSHKYDPLSQEEFFRVFAILNQSQDADRRDESPLLELWSAEQLKAKADGQVELAHLDQTLKTVTPELVTAQQAWEAALPRSLAWSTLKPSAAKRQGEATLEVSDNGLIRARTSADHDTYSLSFQTNATRKLTALQLQTVPQTDLPGGGAGFGGGNFVLTRVRATIEPAAGTRPQGRFVRIEIPGDQKILSLAEVQVFDGPDNIARSGKATQSSLYPGGTPELAIDGNTDGRYAEAKSTTHTAVSDNPWWELDLQGLRAIDRVVLWNRTDAGVETRLSNFRVAVLDEQRQPVWEETVVEHPHPSREFALSGTRGITWKAAFADFEQPSFLAADVIVDPSAAGAKKAAGWAVGGQANVPHQLTLIPAAPVEIPAGSTLLLSLVQESQHTGHVLAAFRLVATDAPQAAEWSRLPAPIVAILQKDAGQRTEAETQSLAEYYRSFAPVLQPARDRLTALKKQLAEMKPATTVPIMREMAANQHRVTKLQHRGNFLDLGQEVTPGIPAVFPALPSDGPPDRLALARWLVARENPLTARVLVNRYWEQIFGTGLVATSEEFGSQGEAPSHPELLDWLAVEVMDSGWDLQHLLKLLVTSAAYRQSSLVTPETYQHDPDNRLLARGPRFRMSAEMIRDQALALSGLLSPKLYGPPVNPPQPRLGVSAAFGSAVDWQTSAGEDKFRRGLYTMWRRSSPYPSMATFDAPNREVCTLRRSRTNTPLQALVTLNDPVYIEAAQALARRIVAEGGDSVDSRIHWAWETCLARAPTPAEQTAAAAFYQKTLEQMTADPADAMKLATVPLGPAPAGVELPLLATWTVFANTLLNLDEVFMRR